ncbi:ABC transporter permease [Prevotella sp. KH2C16]|uniref:ABC transporter permease n=1 Tax=Prevotella sp. KH2C16 TaxID=1855325 RepID=UPI0008F294EB|nr:ABC transporter permease [Prevotella sp. KH2C16]SFG16864.1 putative ABC transport system permease protein [Prevotella sp. KH2C16]
MTIFRFILGLALIVLPLYILYAFQVKILRKVLVGAGKMAAYLLLTGLCLYFVMEWNSLFLNLLCFLLMTLAASGMTVRRARLLGGKYVVPVAVGVIVSVLVIGLYFLFFVMGLQNPFDARYFVPVLGIMTGGMIETNAKALSTYYAGLEHHNQLYYYLVGNGATHDEAVKHFFRRALERAALPWIHQMGYMVVGVSPVILWVMLFMGSSVLEALAYQMLIMILMFAASLSSLLITLYAARKYSFDEYDNLKPGK